MDIESQRFRVNPGELIDLAKQPTRVQLFADSDEQYKQLLKSHVKELSSLQRLHYATNKSAFLLIIQGMDASGKDGIIRHVMSGINPQGCQVSSFKQPTHEELRHDFLWRTTLRLPEHGQIGIFNRSYYEEVLIVRVHPELLEAQGISKDLGKENDFWRERYRSISNYEDHLHRNGTKVVKVFLHISKDEQAKRLRQRIESPEKNWKFNLSDIQEREFWNDYMRAYEACLNTSSTIQAPWYLVPADDKESARLIVSQILVDSFKAMDMKYPEIKPKRRQELETILAKL